MVKNILNLCEIENEIKNKHVYLNEKIILIKKNIFNFLKVRKKIILPELGFKVTGYIFNKQGEYFFTEHLPYVLHPIKVYKTEIHIRSVFDVNNISTHVKTEIKVQNTILLTSKGYIIFLYHFFISKRKIWILKTSEQQKQQLLQAII